MRLLIITQAVDRADPVLGFFHRWIEEFAKSCEHVHVVCLKEGEHALPSNVTVYSLGKESSRSRFMYIFRFYRYIWSLRREYDAVFVHMNPEYLVAAGWLWRLIGIRTLLWYSHRNVDLKLRIAEYFASIVATSAASSFRLPSRKLHVLGHGIDLAAYTATPRNHSTGRIVSVGRITPIKRLEVAIGALAEVRRRGIDATLILVGDPVTNEDRAYMKQLQNQVQHLGLRDSVVFRGSIPHADVASVYFENSISLNLAPTGGLDKAVLESMACALPTIVSNEGFIEYLGSYSDRLLFRQDDVASLVTKLSDILRASDAGVIGAYLRSQVSERASLQNLVTRILALLKS